MPCSRCTTEKRECTFDGGPSALLSSVSSQAESSLPKKRKPRRKSSGSPEPDKRRKPTKREDSELPTCCLGSRASLTDVHFGIYAHFSLVLFRRRSDAIFRLNFWNAYTVSICWIPGSCQGKRTQTAAVQQDRPITSDDQRAGLELPQSSASRRYG